MSSWRITVRDIEKIYLDVYARLLGLMWMKNPKIDKTRFKTDDNYRRGWVRLLLGTELPRDFRIGLEKCSSNHYILTNCGIDLPVVKQPKDFNDIFVRYEEARPPRVAGVVPGLDRHIGTRAMIAYVKGSRGYPSFQTLGKDECSKTLWRVLMEREKNNKYAWQLPGRDLRTIKLYLPNFCAHLWMDKSGYDDIRDEKNTHTKFEKRFRKYYREEQATGHLEIDSRLQISKDLNRKELAVSDKGLIVPLPKRPDDINDLYKAWAHGEAGIPTYTYTPS